MQKYILYRGTNTYNLYYNSCVFGELLIKEYELDTTIQQVKEDIKRINEENGINAKTKLILNI